MNEKTATTAHGGSCPTCRRNSGYRYAPGPDGSHWFVCDTHQAKWDAVEKIPLFWKEEVMAQVALGGEIFPQWKMPDSYTRVTPIEVEGPVNAPIHVPREVIESLDFLLNFATNPDIRDFYQMAERDSAFLRNKETRARNSLRNWLGAIWVRGFGGSLEQRWRVDLGEVRFLSNVRDYLPRKEVRQAILRHRLGDWGEVDHKQWLANDLSAENGFCVSSLYRSQQGIQFWMTTERSRLKTRVMLAGEDIKRISASELEFDRKQTLTPVAKEDIQNQIIRSQIWHFQRHAHVLSKLRRTSLGS